MDIQLKGKKRKNTVSVVKGKKSEVLTVNVTVMFLSFPKRVSCSVLPTDNRSKVSSR